MSKTNKPFYLQETSVKKGAVIFALALIVMFAIAYLLGYAVMSLGLKSVGIK